MKLKPYKPSGKRPWNFQRVWMLHRRAGFGGTWEELQRDLADGPEKSVSRFFEGSNRVSGVPENFHEMRVILGDSAVASQRPERLIAWWVYQMYFSPNPLQERLSLMWHNHFATSNSKVKDLTIMREQNEIFREAGSGKFKALLASTVKHSAMLKWLDGDENRLGKPNENLGRELLELFTLGVGNFSESDVKEASRALTGWSIKERQFQSREDWHDSESKTILGKTGDFDGDDLIEIAIGHVSTAKRIAWRICNEFLSQTVMNDEVIDELADILKSGNHDINLAVETVLRSELFFSDENIKQRIVEPESFVVGLIRSLEMFKPPASTLVLADWIEQLGRKLFYPPNVGGWPGGKSWLNSRTIIARANYGSAMVAGNLHRGGVAPDLIALANQHVKSDDLETIASFYSKLITGIVDEKQMADVMKKSQDGNPKRDIVLQRAVVLLVASSNAQLC